MQPNQPNDYQGRGEEGPVTDEKPEMYAPVADDSDENFMSNNQTSDNNDLSRENEADLAHWTADEYEHEAKSTLWFVMFVLVAVALILIDVFFIKSYTFSVLIAVMAVALFIYSRRPPQLIDYTLSSHGLYVGEKLHSYAEFKAFGVIQNKNNNMIVLIPIKRFSPSVTAIFPGDSGEKIVDILGARLPMEQIKPDFLDFIVKKLHI